MNIKIENIGKINKADINIDGITVIAGENNTGKSTVGKALFATFDSLFGYSDYIELQKAKYIEQILRLQIKNLDMLLKNIFGAQRGESGSSIKLIEEYLPRYIYNSSHNDIKEITKQFCLEYSSRYKLSSKIVLEEQQIIEWISIVTENIAKLFSVEDKNVGNKKITRTFSGIFNKQIIRIPNNYSEAVEDGKIRLNIKGQESSLYFSREKEDVCVDNTQTFEVMHRPIFIESSRVVNNLSRIQFDNMSETDWIKFLCRPNGLSFYLADSINRSDDRTETNDDEMNDYIIIQLEDKLKIIEEKLNSVIKGKFIKVNNELQFKSDNFSESFKLSNLSTGLKAFALLQRIIELGVLREKDILIFDEPEINLHPEWQLIYAELIIIMQQQLDLTVLITTHSPYFLNAIEVYTKKYGIDNNCHYYLADEVDGDIEFNDVTDNTESIYKKLFTPLQKLEDIEYNGEVVE